MICLLSWVARMVIRTIAIHVWIFYFHSGILLVMWFVLWSTGVQVWPMWILLWGSVGCTWMWVAFISGVVWWACVHGWFVVWSVWCVMVRLMAITPVCWICALWATPVVVAIIPMLWSGMASIWIIMTWAAVSVEMWLWPGMTLPSLSSWQCLEHDLAWRLLCGLDWWCFASVPEGGILCGQSSQCDHTHHIQNT